MTTIPSGFTQRLATNSSGHASFASSNTDNTVTYFDAKGPTIQVINTIPDHADRALSESEVVNISLMQPALQFSQDVYNPAGDSDTDDATNPNNYMLIRDLGDTAGFQTVSCSAGAVTPADTKIAIGTVTYDNATYTATFTVNSSLPLSNGTYRLFVCGTTSIVDPLNTAPALVGSNGPNSDFIRNFTINIPEGGNNGGSEDRNRRDGEASNLRSAAGLIPVTGFAPGKVPHLPAQPADKVYFSTGGMRLEIPSLSVYIPIVGVQQTTTGWNLTWLGKNAGYLEGTAYPTWKGNTVLTAHVLDAMSAPGPFAYLKELKNGGSPGFAAVRCAKTQ